MTQLENELQGQNDLPIVSKTGGDTWDEIPV
jgi:hypothetical protein